MGHPVDATADPIPIARMDVIRVRVVRVPGLNRLLGRKIALLVLRDRHQSSKRVIFLHAHILNLFEELCKSGFLRTLKMPGAPAVGHPWDDTHKHPASERRGARKSIAKPQPGPSAGAA